MDKKIIHDCGCCLSLEVVGVKESCLWTQTPSRRT